MPTVRGWNRSALESTGHASASAGGSPCDRTKFLPGSLVFPPDRSGALAQEVVCRALSRDGFRVMIPQRAQFDAVEQLLPRPEQHRPHGEVHLVDQTLAQVLA